MVVLDDVGLRVEVAIGGRPAQEWSSPEQDDDDDEITMLDDGPSTCHRYIESVAGADFSITVKALYEHHQMNKWLDYETKTDTHTIKFSVLIDGLPVGGTFVTNAQRDNVFRGVNNHDDNTRQLFRFAQITLSKYPSFSLKNVQSQKADWLLHS